MCHSIGTGLEDAICLLLTSLGVQRYFFKRRSKPFVENEASDYLGGESKHTLKQTYFGADTSECKIMIQLSIDPDSRAQGHCLC